MEWPAGTAGMGGGSMQKVKVCIIGGGSRLWAIQFLKDLTLQDKVEAHVVLYDIDEGAALNNEKVANEIFRVNGKEKQLSVSVANEKERAGNFFEIVSKIL